MERLIRIIESIPAQNGIVVIERAGVDDIIITTGRCASFFRHIEHEDLSNLKRLGDGEALDSALTEAIKNLDNEATTAREQTIVPNELIRELKRLVNEIKIKMED